MCRSFFLLLFNCAYCNLNEILWHIIDSWRCAVCWWDDSFTNMVLWKLGILFILTYFILLAKQFFLTLETAANKTSWLKFNFSLVLNLLTISPCTYHQIDFFFLLLKCSVSLPERHLQEWIILWINRVLIISLNSSSTETLPA